MSENIIMPKLGMTMKEGTVEEWFKSEGDTVEEGESIVTISSEKLTNDVEAPTSGTLLKIKVQAGEDAKVKAVLGIIGEEGEDVGSDDDDSEETTQENKDNDTTSEDQQASSNEEQSDKKDTEKEAKPEQRDRIFISPLARNMAKDKDLDITRIKGTGGNDRITKLDIQRVDSEGYDYEGEAGTSNESASSTAHNFDVSSIGGGLNPMRQRIAQNMRQSLNNTAQLTLHRKVNADRLLDFKARLSEELKDADQDVKLTVTALLAKA
ncbi:MAG: 2-oxo acid dehydrogenase subunit E2, partial [Staphylococcus hominis]